MTLVALFGPAFSPDPSSDANEQFPALAFAPPGTEVDVMQLPNGERIAFHPPFRISGAQLPADQLKNYKSAPNTIQDTLRFKPLRREGKPIEVTQLVPSAYAPATSTKKFILGADGAGRDVLARLILGLRITLAIGAASVLLSLLIGGTLGALAGYFGGWVDKAVMAAVNIFWALPSLLLVIVLSLTVGRSLAQLFFVVGFTMWPDVARMTRGEVLSLKSRPYVEAGRLLGYSHFRLLWRHILPGIVPTLAIISAGNFATAILLESGLSFLGIGVQPPTPSWGSMVKEGYSAILFGARHLIIAPTLALILLVMAFSQLGSAISRQRQA